MFSLSNQMKSSIHLLAIGDAGDSTPLRSQNVLSMTSYQQQLGQHLDGILYLGDNFYNNGITSTYDPLWRSHFEDVYPSELNCPFFSILGNHDYLGNPDAQVAYSSSKETRWKMPYRYYSVDFDLDQDQRSSTTTLLEIFFLDTFTLSPTESKTLSLHTGMNPTKWNTIEQKILFDRHQQLQWLEQCLQNSNAVWKIVCGHYTMFSDGEHHDNFELQQVLLPLFLKYNVSLYLCGHDHNVQHIPLHRGIHCLIAGTGSRVSPLYPSRSLVPPSLKTGIAYVDATPHNLEFGFVVAGGQKEYSYELTKYARL